MSEPLEPTADYFAGKRVTLTGGSGFLGSHVTDRLAHWSAGPVQR